MLKQSYDQGVADALEKLGFAGPLLQKLVGTALRNPNATLAGIGALGGALAGGEGNRMEGALAGAGLGYGAGRLGASKYLKGGILGKPQWLGQDAANYAQSALKARFGG